MGPKSRDSSGAQRVKHITVKSRQENLKKCKNAWIKFETGPTISNS